MATTNLLQYLNKTGVPFELLTHVPAFSAHDVAAATHIPDSESAKTIIIRADDSKWMVVLPADHRLNENMVRHALGAKHIHFVQEEELISLFPDCEVGAMPPLGNLYSIQVIVDKSITHDEEIVFNACTHTESIKMKYKDFENLVKPRIAQIAEPLHSAEDREW